MLQTLTSPPKKKKKTKPNQNKIKVKNKTKQKEHPNTKYYNNTKNHYESFIKPKLTQTYNHKFQ